MSLKGVLRKNGTNISELGEIKDAMKFMASQYDEIMKGVVHKKKIVVLESERIFSSIQLCGILKSF